ncbi:hypothetical protein HispidOSU_013655 [Sigmodon hispidus]
MPGEGRRKEGRREKGRTSTGQAGKATGVHGPLNSAFFSPLGLCKARPGHADRLSGERPPSLWQVWNFSLQAGTQETHAARRHAANTTEGIDPGDTGAGKPMEEACLD